MLINFNFCILLFMNQFMKRKLKESTNPYFGNCSLICTFVLKLIAELGL